MCVPKWFIHFGRNDTIESIEFTKLLVLLEFMVLLFQKVMFFKDYNFLTMEITLTGNHWSRHEELYATLWTIQEHFPNVGTWRVLQAC